MTFANIPGGTSTDRMQRVLFVRPRALSNRKIGKVLSPPVGALSLISYARQERPGADYFELHDEHVAIESEARFLERIRRGNFDLVAFTYLSVEAERAAALARLVRIVSPDLPIVAGGPHASAYGASVLEEGPFDYVIQGEAEISFIRFLERIEAGDREPTEKISGLVFRRGDGSLYECPKNSELPDIHRLPMPAYDLIDFDDYRANRMTPTHDSRSAPLFSSRGCPYRCTYCHDIFQKGFRAMKPERVVDELQHLIEVHGVDDFEVFDDIFNADKKRALAICSEIDRRGLKTRFSFPNGVRGDRMDPDLLDALHSVGTYHMAFAIESASPRIQKQIRKHNHLDKLQTNLAYASKLGIFTWGFFMLGFPGETRAEIQATVDYACESPLHGAFFFIVVPYGGTPMSQELGSELPEALAAPHLAPSVTESLEDSSTKAFDPLFSAHGLSELSADELRNAQRLAYLRFFFDPMRMKRMVKDYPAGYPGLVRRGLGSLLWLTTRLEKWNGEVEVSQAYKLWVNAWRRLGSLQSAG